MLFPMRKVGLDFSPQSITAVVMRLEKERWVIERTITKAISTRKADKYGTAPGDDVVSIIQPLFDELSLNSVHRRLWLIDRYFRSKYVVTSISGRNTIVKILSLPPIHNVADLTQIMRYQLEQHLPLPFPETAYDYHVIKQTEEGTTVLLVAVRRKTLTEHLALLAQAGITPEAVMPSFVMVYNALLYENALPQDGITGIIRFAGDLVDVLLVEQGILSMARSIMMEAQEAPHDFLRELKNTLSACAGTKSIEKLILLTENDSLPYDFTVELLQEALAVPFAEVESHGEAEASPVCSIGTHGTACEHRVFRNGFAAGLVADSMSPHAISLNLLKPLQQEQQEQRKQARREKIWTFAPYVATVVLTFLALVLFHHIQQAKSKLSIQQRQQKIIEFSTQTATELQNKIKQWNRQIKALHWVDDGYPLLSYRLYNISQAIPDNIWLTDISTPKLKRGTQKEVIPIMSSLTITGYASTQAEIDAFKRRLLECDCFSELHQLSAEERMVQKEKLLMFRIQAISSAARVSKKLNSVALSEEE